jgi:hypothetical protein
MAAFSPLSEVWRTTPESSPLPAQPPRSNPPVRLTQSKSGPTQARSLGPTRPIRARAVVRLMLGRDSAGVRRLPVFGVRAAHGTNSRTAPLFSRMPELLRALARRPAASSLPRTAAEGTRRPSSLPPRPAAWERRHWSKQAPPQGCPRRDAHLSAIRVS